MADYYVWGGATGAGTGASWADAYTTITAALAGATGAGPHNLIVDYQLAESVTSAAVNLNAATSGGTIAIISVDRGGRTTGTAHDGYKAGAAISVGTNAFAVNIGTARSQTMIIKGVTVTGNSGTSASNAFNIANTTGTDVDVQLLNCSISCPGSSTSAIFAIGAIAGSTARRQRVRIADTSFAIANRTTGAGIQLDNASLEISGMTVSYAGANKPAQLFTTGATDRCGQAVIKNSDLSGFNTTSGAYFLLTNLVGRWEVFNCKLSSTPSITTGSWPNAVGSICLVNTDSADTKVQYRYQNQRGTVTDETTYDRTNGAKMYGAGIAWKIVTTASCTEHTPFMLPAISRVLATAQSTTLGVELLSATQYTDREVWARIDRISDASFPLGSEYSSRNATPFVGTGVNLTGSSEGWAGSLSGGIAQKIATTVTPSEVSKIRAQVFVGVASATLYLDPCLLISGQTDGPRVSWEQSGEAGNDEPNSVWPGLTIQSIGTY